MIAAHLGNRDQHSAQKLWDSMPKVYRQCAVINTDDWEAYQAVLPAKRHRVVPKERGKTSYIERFNCTLRQRVHALSDVIWRFPRHCAIILDCCGISFTTTTHHYLFSSTETLASKL
ncbi:MAG: IS1 family transposase [Leptolyngbya sp. SIO1D8]|nr:IS1 family transposase [Leptolyngbya sp. SIO1D8]